MASAGSPATSPGDALLLLQLCRWLDVDADANDDDQEKLRGRWPARGEG